MGGRDEQADAQIRALAAACSSVAYGEKVLQEPSAGEAEAKESVSDLRRGNICFGGLEDGKLIRNDDRVDNPFRQTSLLGCLIEGGQPVYLPDLKPAIPNGVLA